VELPLNVLDDCVDNEVRRDKTAALLHAQDTVRSYIMDVKAQNLDCKHFIFTSKSDYY
jgi:hypothetical protein